MNRINPNSKKHKEQLRKIGKRVLTFGVVMSVIGLFSFFSSFGSSGPPRFFWCAFVGFPCISIGGVLLFLGYLEEIMRYVSGAANPVMKDSVNYLGSETSKGVENISKAFFSGSKETPSVEKRLEKLETLYSNKLISEEEYKRERTRILNSL